MSDGHGLRIAFVALRPQGERMKAWLRSQPVVSALYRRYVVSNSPGAWLFNHATAGWLYDPQLTATLPIHLKAFAAYCRVQRRMSLSGHILGGPGVFKHLAKLGRRFRAQDSLRVVAGAYVIHLDSYDPRLLQVPNELLPGAEHAPALQRFLHDGDTFIDVGANHGSLSVLAAHRVGNRGLVVAVEPQTKLASLVERSLRDNARAPYRVHCCALGDEEGEAQLFVPAGTSGSAGLHPGFSGTAEHETRRVRLTTLERLLDGQILPGEMLLKLDVEGNELSVLRGARRLIAKHHPTILIEVNDASMKAAKVSHEMLIAELKALGYVCYVEETALDEVHQLEALAGVPARNVIVGTRRQLEPGPSRRP